MGRTSFRNFYDDYDDGAQQPKPYRSRVVSTTTSNGSVSTSMSTVQTSNKRGHQFRRDENNISNKTESSFVSASSTFDDTISNNDDNDDITMDTTWYDQSKSRMIDYKEEEEEEENDEKSDNGDERMVAIEERWSRDHALSPFQIMEEPSETSVVDYDYNDDSDAGWDNGDIENQQEQQHQQHNQTMNELHQIEVILRPASQNSSRRNRQHVSSSPVATTSAATKTDDLSIASSVSSAPRQQSIGLSRSLRNGNNYYNHDDFDSALEHTPYRTNNKNNTKYLHSSSQHSNSQNRSSLPATATATTDDLSIASSVSSAPRQQSIGLSRFLGNCNNDHDDDDDFDSALGNTPPPNDTYLRAPPSLEYLPSPPNVERNLSLYSESSFEPRGDFHYEYENNNHNDDAYYENFDAQTDSALTNSSADYPGAHRIYDNHRVRLRKHEPVDDPHQYSADNLTTNSIPSEGRCNSPADEAAYQNELDQSTVEQSLDYVTEGKPIHPCLRVVIKCAILVACGAVVVLVVLIAKGPKSNGPTQNNDSSGGTSDNELDISMDPLFLQRVDNLTQIIIQNGWTNAQKFDVQDSPQSFAIQKLAQEQFTTSATTFDVNVDKEQYVLAVLYYTFNGPTWPFPYKDWIVTVAKNENNDLCNNMDYITCNDNNEINGIIIPPGVNKMDAVLPQEWFLLASLNDLRIVQNNLVDIESPMSTLIEFPQLKTLDLSLNVDLEIGFPDWLFRMTDLETLDFLDCDINGTLSTDIGSLINLKFLVAGRNALTGEIPSEIGLLTNLLSLVIDNNKFEGTLPSVIGHLTQLEELNIAGSGLSGFLPEQVQNLTNLQRLTVGGKTSGKIESWIGELTNLNELVFTNIPYINGTIPSEIGNLSLLTSLSFLGATKLDGSIPTEIGKLSLLESLVVTDAYLTGTIPTEIGNLSNLVTLFLSGTAFDGSIPTEVGYLSNLVHLRLDYQSPNDLPSELGKLASLKHLHVEPYKQESGNVPKEICDLEHLESLCVATRESECNNDLPCKVFSVPPVVDAQFIP